LNVVLLQPKTNIHRQIRQETITYMKTRIQSLIITALVALPFLAATPGNTQPLPGLPEPGLIMYGALNTANGSPPFYGSGVFWNVSNTTNSFVGQAAVIVVSGQVFYVLRVPFETRSIPGSETFLGSREG
jgi:hypothetical protein